MRSRGNEPAAGIGRERIGIGQTCGIGSRTGAHRLGEETFGLLLAEEAVTVVFVAAEECRHERKRGVDSRMVEKHLLTEIDLAYICRRGRQPAAYDHEQQSGREQQHRCRRYAAPRPFGGHQTPAYDRIDEDHGRRHRQIAYDGRNRLTYRKAGQHLGGRVDEYLRVDASLPVFVQTGIGSEYPRDEQRDENQPRHDDTAHDATAAATQIGACTRKHGQQRHRRHVSGRRSIQPQAEDERPQYVARAEHTALRMIIEQPHAALHDEKEYRRDKYACYEYQSSFHEYIDIRPVDLSLRTGMFFPLLVARQWAVRRVQPIVSHPRRLAHAAI